MPPEDEPKLTAEERRVILDWLNPTIERAVKLRQSKGGRVVVRRLNRSEYQNTLSDLFGVRLDYTRDFPPDGVSPDGMLNNGSSLQMSDIQLEFYIAAARAALDRIITTEEEPKVFRHRFTKSTDGGFPDGVQGANDLGRHRQFIVRMKNDYPEQGAFRIRTAVRVELPEKKGPMPRLRVRVGYRPDTLVDMETLAELDLHEAGGHELEFVGRIENFPLPVRGQGKYPGLVVMLSNAHDEFSQTGKTQQREITGEDGKKKKYGSTARAIRACTWSGWNLRGRISTNGRRRNIGKFCFRRTYARYGRRPMSARCSSRFSPEHGAGRRTARRCVDTPVFTGNCDRSFQIWKARYGRRW